MSKKSEVNNLYKEEAAVEYNEFQEIINYNRDVLKPLDKSPTNSSQCPDEEECVINEVKIEDVEISEEFIDENGINNREALLKKSDSSVLPQRNEVKVENMQIELISGSRHLNKSSTNSEIDEELLITTVQDYPNIYDLSHTSYHNNLMKDNSWEEIGEILKFPADICRSKWKCLRESYRKAMATRRTKNGQAAKKMKPWRLESQMEFLKPHICPQREEQHSNIPPLSTLPAVDNETNSDGENDTATNCATEWNQTESVKEKEDSGLTLNSPSTSGMSRRSLKASTKSGKRTLPNGSAAEMLRHYMTMKMAWANEKSTTIPSSSGDHLTKFFQSIEETVRTLPPHFQIRLKSQISQLVHNAEYEAIPNKQFQQPPLPTQPPFFQLPPQSHLQTQTSQTQPFQLHPSLEPTQSTLPKATFYDKNDLSSNNQFDYQNTPDSV